VNFHQSIRQRAARGIGRRFDDRQDIADLQRADIEIVTVG